MSGGSAAGWKQTTSPSRHLYGAANLLTQQNVVELDLLPNSWLRAPGEAVGTFVLESAMDELAYELGMDPIELRMRNEPDADPMEGKPFSQRMLREAFARGCRAVRLVGADAGTALDARRPLAGRHGRRHRLPHGAAD